MSSTFRARAIGPGLGREIARIARFVAVGAANSGLTYVLYLALRLLFPYALAYTLSFLTGILFSLWANTRFVFGTRASLRIAAQYGLLYLGNYAAGLLLLVFAVETLGLDARIAPLPVAGAVAVLSYLGTRFVLRRRAPA